MKGKANSADLQVFRCQDAALRRQLTIGALIALSATTEDCAHRRNDVSDDNHISYDA